jgi:hypothetical protein
MSVDATAAYSAESISAPRNLLEPLDQPLALQPGQPLNPEQAIQLSISCWWQTARRPSDSSVCAWPLMSR